MSRVRLDKTAFRITPNLYLGPKPGARLYVYDRGTTDEVTGYTTESGSTEVTYPLTAASDGSYTAWYPSGSYDLYSPDDIVNPTVQWEAIVADELNAETLLASDAEVTGDWSFDGLYISDLPTTPEAHGAVGDGTTDDFTALQAALTTGKRVLLKRGATYLSRHQLSATTDGQVIEGNGATIKRAAQVATTTTTTITSGVTNQITVASAAGLQVGDQIVVEKSGVFDPSPRTVSAIVGTTVTVSGHFGVSLSGTINVYTAWNMLNVQADDAVVRDVIFDGNSSNWTWARWENTTDCYIVGPSQSNALVEHCHFKNTPGDALAFIDVAGGRAAFNTVEDCNGRGIVLGGEADNARVVYNRLVNVEIDSNVSLSSGGGGSTDGHGAILYSTPVVDSLIHGNFIDTAVTGIGRIHVSTNSDVTITDNEIRNCSSYGINGTGDADSLAANVLIRGNRIYACTTAGLAIDTPGGTTTPGPPRWTVEGNLFYEATVILRLVFHCIVANNQFYSAGTSVTHLLMQNNGHASASCSYVTVRGNQFIGGNKAVAPPTNGRHILIDGNVMFDQYTRGVESATGTKGLAVLNNSINSGASRDNSNWVAIRTDGANPVTVRGNVINCEAGGYGAIVVVAGTGHEIDYNSITGNAGSTPRGVVVQGGSYHVVTFNRTNIGTNGISDSGTSTFRKGNRVRGVGALSGTATLSGGTVTVTAPEVKSASRIKLQNVSPGGTVGVLSVGTITDATSFVINSSSGSDTSQVAWEIDN